MNLLTRLIRKLLLVKEIVSKEGVLHFRRYRLLQTPWLAIYVHQICKSDDDLFPHDHPWSFASCILEGAYQEDAWYPPHFDVRCSNTYYSGDVIEHEAEDAHKLTLISKEVWTLVFTSGRERLWGYQTKGGWVDFQTYRQLKNEGKLS
jgi:hypothetical protein